LRLPGKLAGPITIDPSLWQEVRAHVAKGVHVFNGRGRAVCLIPSATGIALDRTSLPDGLYHVTRNVPMGRRRVIERH